MKVQLWASGSESLTTFRKVPLLPLLISSRYSINSSKEYDLFSYGCDSLEFEAQTIIFRVGGGTLIHLKRILFLKLKDNYILIKSLRSLQFHVQKILTNNMKKQSNNLVVKNLQQNNFKIKYQILFFLNSSGNKIHWNSGEQKWNRQSYIQPMAVLISPNIRMEKTWQHVLKALRCYGLCQRRSITGMLC